jgi:hypothetical protein
MESDTYYNPFSSLHHAYAWCCYHANFVARKWLPSTVLDLVYGAINVFGYSVDEENTAIRKSQTILNSVANFFPLLAAHVCDVHVGRKTRKLGWVSLCWHCCFGNRPNSLALQDRPLRDGQSLAGTSRAAAPAVLCTSPYD